MTPHDAYIQFLKSKALVANEDGFDIAASDLSSVSSDDLATKVKLFSTRSPASALRQLQPYRWAATAWA